MHLRLDWPRLLDTETVAGRKRWWLGGGLVIALGVGWLLSELLHGQSTASPSRIEVDRQVSTLLKRRDQQPLSRAEEHRLIERLLALGRIPESIVLVQEQLDTQPKDWRWRLLLSHLELRNGNTTGAESQLQILRRLHPNNLDVLQAMAMLRLQQGRPAEAMATVQSALGSSALPQRISIGLLLADLQRQNGDRAAALGTYQQLSKDAPLDARPLMAQALLLQEQGQRTQALALLESARQKQLANGESTQLVDGLAARWGLMTTRSNPTVSSTKSSIEPPPTTGTPNP